MREPRSKVTWSLVVDRPVPSVFDPFAEGRNREVDGALRNVARPDDGGGSAGGPFGPARLRLRPDRISGTFDPEFVVRGGAGTIPSCAHPNRRGWTPTGRSVRPAPVSPTEFGRRPGVSFDREMDGCDAALGSRR